MNEWFLQWITYIEMSGFTEQTIKTKKRMVKAFLSFLDGRPLSKESLLDYSASLAKKGIKKYSHYTYCIHVKKFLDYLFNRNLIQCELSQYLQMPKIKRPKNSDSYTKEEISEIFTSFNKPRQFHNRFLLEFLYCTGVRHSELINVELFDLDLDKRTVFIRGKGNKGRNVPLTHSMVDLINRYLSEVREKREPLSSKLFIKQDGKPYREMALTGIFSTIKKKIPVKLHERFHPHVFRHSVATHLMQNGVNIELIKEFLGHSSIETSAIYTHVIKSELIALVDTYHPRNNMLL